MGHIYVVKYYTYIVKYYFKNLMIHVKTNLNFILNTSCLHITYYSLNINAYTSNSRKCRMAHYSIVLLY